MLDELQIIDLDAQQEFNQSRWNRSLCVSIIDMFAEKLIRNLT